MLQFKRIWLIGALVLGGLIAGGWVVWTAWQGQQKESEGETDTSTATTPATKIIVGDQAQKNLGITAKQLKADEYWKTITVQGMVVDRPGISDREVVAPATGNVSEILHVAGDTVRPGEVLFTLKLASESLHQTQADLFKTSQDIKLAETRRKQLAAAGEAIAQVRVTEIENEIARLEVAVKAFRQELLNRGLSRKDIDGIADGALISEISIVVPPPTSGQAPLNGVRDSTTNPPKADDPPLAFEVQELKVDLGEQVQAGQTLCHLSNHQSLTIEGRAFRDETTLLERSIKEGWPVEVDFQEDATADWPAIDRPFSIRYIANTIDPVTRTFAFHMPLENQSKTVEHGDRTQLLWRFRPGQKVRLHVKVERLDDVFALPADAVATEGPEAFVFIQNVNTFERRAVHVLLRDRDRVVVANDGSLPTYIKGKERWTIPAVSRAAATQLNRMAKAGSSGVPKGYHIHADGSLHKNHEEE